MGRALIVVLEAIGVHRSTAIAEGHFKQSLDGIQSQVNFEGAQPGIGRHLKFKTGLLRGIKGIDVGTIGRSGDNICGRTILQLYEVVPLV